MYLENAEMNFPEAGFAASCRSRRQRQRGAHRSSGRRWEPRGQGGSWAGRWPDAGPGPGRAGACWSPHHQHSGMARAAVVPDLDGFLVGNFGSPLALNSVAPVGRCPHLEEL